MVQTCPGSDAEELEQRLLYEAVLIYLGLATRTIFLNGGSETRAATRNYWREYAKQLNLPFKAYGGWAVEIGGLK